MSAYYEPPQWPPSGQAGWEHQTPPPARSGASSAIPREESAAFSYQLEEVDRAIDNLVKSGKMFGAQGGGGRHGRMSAGPSPRSHSSTDFGDARGPHQSTNLQNFYASQRHQSSRGSNEAEQMMQAKRRMAAQRERELRNYHQEQQFNRTVLAEQQFGPKPDRALSPGSMSEEDRRKLITQQRNALYGGGGSYSEGSEYDETGVPRPGLSAPQGGPSALRGHSPLAYEYGRPPPVSSEAAQQPLAEGAPVTQPAGPNERSRANSNASPQSNPAGNKGVFDAPAAQQSSRTSASSPGGSPPRQGVHGGKPGQGSVAPIGTRPSGSNKRSSPPVLSPLHQGYQGGDDNGAASQNQPSSAIDSPSVGLPGWGSRPGGGWGSKSGLGTQANVPSVWG